MQIGFPQSCEGWSWATSQGQDGGKGRSVLSQVKVSLL